MFASPSRNSRKMTDALKTSPAPQAPATASNPARELPRKAPGGGVNLLAGVRVLDLTTSIAGPYATQLLSDFGAEVVKIERPGQGDDSRGWGPPFLEGRSLWHASVNRNKKSVTLDLRKEEGYAVFLDLVQVCDIFITNQLASLRQRLRTDHETLARHKPDLVYVSLTGHGSSGPRAEWACYDIIAEGYSSVMDVTGEAENDPQKVGTPAADLLAGADAALSAIAALFDAKQTGRGHFVDVSLVASMTRFMSPRIMTYLGSGIVPRRTGAKDSVIAVYQTFDTADDMITLALPNDNIWHRFWAAMGDAEFGRDPRFATSEGRHAHRPEIVRKIAGLLRAQPRDHWLALFNAAQIPAGPINRIDEVTKDPELIRQGLFYSVDGEDGGEPWPQCGLGILVDGRDAGYRSPPPPLGANTEEVLAGLLAYDADRIAKLRQQRVI
jgi:crotonobetainyl-CoA:carnitine CoA-transferase CaiB-like acyl-CoA transferase